jgi:O-antigen/teichoic acid export membrane protein
MTVVNFINLALPLLTIPYLISTLGTHGYGVLAYHQYLGQFALVVLEFGFPLYAVSEVARRCEDSRALGRFIADVYLIKLAVAGLTALGLALVVGVANFLKLEGLSVPLLCVFVLTAAFNSFAPTWFFQGLDAPQKSVLPTLVARLVTLASTFVIVRSPADILLAAVPYMLGAAVMMCTLSWRAARVMTYNGTSSRSELRQIFGESLQVFWSRLTIMGYVTVSPVIINLSAGAQGVAVYNLCEKAITVARMPFDMFSAATFARFSRSYDAEQIRRFLVPLGVGGIVFTCLLSLCAPLASRLLNVQGLELLWRYLPIYGLALIPISMHGFLGTCSLLTNGKRLELAKSIATGLFCYAISVAALWKFVDNKVLLSIIGMVLVEAGIFFSRLFFVIRYRLI